MLQLERRHGFGNLEKIGRLAVDGAQRITHLRKNFLLSHHDSGIAFGPLHQRLDRLEIGLIAYAELLHAQFAVASLQSAHVAGQHTRTLHHIGEGLGATHQGLRNRFCKALRLHQRLSSGRQLLCRTLGLAQDPAGNQCQQNHAQRQKHQQSALMLRRRGLTQQRQRDAIDG